MWFLFVAGICCFAQTDIVWRGGTASVDFLNFNYSSKNNGLKWSNKLSLAFSQQKFYLKKLFILKYKLTYYKKK